MQRSHGHRLVPSLRPGNISNRGTYSISLTPERGLLWDALPGGTQDTHQSRPFSKRWSDSALRRLTKQGRIARDPRRRLFASLRPRKRSDLSGRTAGSVDSSRPSGVARGRPNRSCLHDLVDNDHSGMRDRTVREWYSSWREFSRCVCRYSGLTTPSRTGCRGGQRFISEEEYAALKRYTVNPRDVLVTFRAHVAGGCGP